MIGNFTPPTHGFTKSRARTSLVPFLQVIDGWYGNAYTKPWLLQVFSLARVVLFLLEDRRKLTWKLPRNTSVFQGNILSKAETKTLQNWYYPIIYFYIWGNFIHLRILYIYIRIYIHEKSSWNHCKMGGLLFCLQPIILEKTWETVGFAFAGHHAVPPSPTPKGYRKINKTTTKFRGRKVDKKKGDYTRCH